MSKVCIAFGHGCMRAEAEVSILSEYFHANGHELCGNIEDADNIVVVGCAFDNCAELSSISGSNDCNNLIFFLGHAVCHTL